MLDRTEQNRLKREVLAYFDKRLAYLGNLSPILGPWAIFGRSSVFNFLGPYFRSSVGLGPRSLSFQN
jgi:hypothetical protein